MSPGEGNRRGHGLGTTAVLEARRTREWTIWAEGFTATCRTGTSWPLNRYPVRAASFDEAVERFREGKANRALFRRADDGTWSYWGCALFDNELDARRVTR